MNAMAMSSSSQALMTCCPVWSRGLGMKATPLFRAEDIVLKGEEGVARQRNAVKPVQPVAFSAVSGSGFA